MASSSRTKTADRQAVFKKLLPLLKKQYKIAVPKLDRPVMETMLYAVCLENTTAADADRVYARLFELFPDLNEARVSSITELEPVFEGLDEKDWRGFRARSVLQYIFDKTYSFEFESLKKKTLELAAKQLGKIRHLTPFIRTFTLQQSIGAHLLPIDTDSAHFLCWMGLASPEQSTDEIGESLKTVVRKAEALQFCFTIRAVASDPQLKAAFHPKEFPPPEGGFDANTSIDRLTELFKTGVAGARAAAKKLEAAAAKSEAKTAKAATKTAAASPSSKSGKHPTKAVVADKAAPAEKTPHAVEKSATKSVAAPEKSAPVEKPKAKSTETAKPAAKKDKPTTTAAATKKAVKKTK